MRMGVLMAVVVVLFHIHRHDIDLPVAHAALGHDAFANAAHFGGGAAQQRGFEAVVVVEMAVERGDDVLAVVVLDVVEQVLEPVAVVVVDERDAAGDLGRVALLRGVLDELGAVVRQYLEQEY